MKSFQGDGKKEGSGVKRLEGDGRKEGSRENGLQGDRRKDPSLHSMKHCEDEQCGTGFDGTQWQ